MDIAVILALTVLGCVFVFSFILLVVMCRRRYEYNRLLVDQSLRFSKLRQDNVDDIIQLSPHICECRFLYMNFFAGDFYMWICCFQPKH